MTEEEFYELQRQIRSLMEKLEAAQRKFIKETGRRFVYGQGIQRYIDVDEDTSKGIAYNYGADTPIGPQHLDHEQRFFEPK